MDHGPARRIRPRLGATSTRAACWSSCPPRRPTRAKLEGADVAGRCQILAADFFQVVPGGADLYLLARVLFSWDDAAATSAMLQRIAAAMSRSRRLVVVNPVLSEGRVYWWLNDLYLLAFFGGRERSLDEHRTLFAAAGLRVARAAPISGELWAFECTRAEASA